MWVGHCLGCRESTERGVHKKLGFGPNAPLHPRFSYCQHNHSANETAVNKQQLALFKQHGESEHMSLCLVASTEQCQTSLRSE